MGTFKLFIMPHSFALNFALNFVITHMGCAIHEKFPIVLKVSCAKIAYSIRLISEEFPEEFATIISSQVHPRNLSA